MPDSVSKRAGRSGQRSRSVMITSQEGARDHELLDLGGALVELRDLRVAEGALDLVVLDEAIAAVHLDRVRGDLHRGLGGEELGHRGGGLIRAAGLLERGGAQSQ